MMPAKGEKHSSPSTEERGHERSHESSQTKQNRQIDGCSESESSGTTELDLLIPAAVRAPAVWPPPPRSAPAGSGGSRT